MFLFTCFISFFLWRLYKWSQIDFNFQREGGRFNILIIEIICICIGVLNVIYCSALSSMSPPASSMAAAAWFWPWGGGGSGQGGSRRSGGGGTGVNTASAGGGAGAGSNAPASAGGGSSAATAGGGWGSSAADCSQNIVSKAFFTSDKEAFLCIRLRMTPQYSIDRSQRTVESPCMLYM